MRGTLLVIDMQPHQNFGSTRRLAQVKREIARAMREGDSIVFTRALYWDTEDPPFPPVHRELMDMVSGYKDVHTVEKNCSDASLHLKNHCPTVPKENIRIVGCNTEGCPTDTAIGIARRFPGAKITVVADACDSVFDLADPFAELREHPEITIEL